MTNRERGDYLERQVKRTLIALGWFVVRAAGSHGDADLVALRAGRVPLLVSCKLNGRIGPGERDDLLAAASVAGARPVLAARRRRGYVCLYVVTKRGVVDLDELRVPNVEGAS